jgi:hypothetical protein
MYAHAHKTEVRVFACALLVISSCRLPENFDCKRRKKKKKTHRIEANWRIIEVTENLCYALHAGEGLIGFLQVVDFIKITMVGVGRGQAGMLQFEKNNTTNRACEKSWRIFDQFSRIRV